MIILVLDYFCFPGSFFFAVNSLVCWISTENSTQTDKSWMVWNVSLLLTFLISFLQLQEFFLLCPLLPFIFVVYELK